MANALVKEGREFMPARPAPRLDGRVGPGRAARAPWCRPPSTTCPPPRWSGSTTPLEADVLVCSDHPEATAATIALVERIDGLRGVDAGSLAQAAAIEAFTAVLITVNIRHKVHAAVRLTGLDERVSRRR